MEAQASSRGSSAWIETSAGRRLGQPSLSQEEGTGVRGSRLPISQALWNPTGCLLGLLGGYRNGWVRKGKTVYHGSHRWFASAP